jgi:ferritin-like metal-binding protein YciE
VSVGISLAMTLAFLAPASPSWLDVQDRVIGSRPLAQDETLKNLYAGFAYQYHQIAAYRSLIVFAERAGHTDHVAGFKQSIEEEKRAAQRVDELIESITRQYIEATLRGEKADS